MDKKQGKRYIIVNIICGVFMKIKGILFIALLLMLFGFNSYGQTTEVDLSVRVPNVSTCILPCPLLEDHIYRINGISTAEDIGGVEISYRGIGSRNFLIFENFNDFPVSVIFEVKRPNGSQTGTVVLRPNEIRETRNEFVFNPINTSFVLIVRRLAS